LFNHFLMIMAFIQMSRTLPSMAHVLRVIARSNFERGSS
jgi:hypothetical protein